MMFSANSREALSRFIGWLYLVTSQGKPPPDAGKRVTEQAGFTFRTVWERVGRSEVVLIVAQK
ncbi:MAG: hypothetical protein DRJ03_17955 [Chloroflexi bacterium]|nr:MAG: hypothetical protein DRI81_13955 [Chloroflexota bacterium]RLC83147.1 MAG: hypothetical protein DRJ03_17955 [Chloroflexota bacterium]